jgi:hypothetical protein
MTVALKNATLGELMRLDSIASHLELEVDPTDPAFVDEAIAAVKRKVAPIARRTSPQNGEDLLASIAAHFGVTFEEVREPGDIAALKHRYLKQRREIGFAVIDDELADTNVDALLFQLTNPRRDSRERFIAILNLQESESRGYWNRSHELSHRLAEPPQKLLPFKRHRFEVANPVERVIDKIAGELAFYPPIFQPLVARAAASPLLAISTVTRIQHCYAPTSSLLATANAVAGNWPRPAIVLTASVGGRKHRPEEAVALRVSVQARNAAARKAELLIWDNMRVPRSSPIFAALHEDRQCEDYENLATWTSSNGQALPNTTVFTSALGLRNRVYAIMSR